jgi:hypothetical protein
MNYMQAELGTPVDAVCLERLNLRTLFQMPKDFISVTLSL